MLSRFSRGASIVKQLTDTPKPPKMYWHNFVAVKYIDNSNRTHRRVMYGSLAKGLNIDLTAFSMEELEELIVCEIFRLIEEGHDLKIHRGSNHIRVWKESSKSGARELSFHWRHINLKINEKNLGDKYYAQATGKTKH